MSLLLFIWVLFLVLLLPIGAESRQTWVALSGGSTATGTSQASCDSASGTSDPGTYYRTIKEALACYGTAAGGGAGHTVLVKDGTYTESFDEAQIGDFMPRGSGTSWASANVFTLKAQNRYGARLLRASFHHTFRVCANGETRDYFTVIDGFTFDYSLQDGADAGGNLGCSPGTVNYFRFQNNDFTTANGGNMLLIGGPAASPANHIEILNNKFHDGTFACPGCGGGAYNYPIYLTGYHHVIRDNEFYNFPGIGLHLNDQDNHHVDDILIDSNYFHHYGTCNQGSGDSVGVTGGAIIWNTGDTVAGGIGQIMNNVFNCGDLAIGAGASMPNSVLIANNTLYDQRGAAGSFSGTGGVSLRVNATTAVRNNIFHAVHAPVIGDSTGPGVPDATRMSNNLCTSACGIGSSNQSEAAATTFVTPGTDFHLKAGSAAINNGTPNIALGFTIPVCSGGITTGCYNGIAPDIGAFETGVAVAGGPPTLTPNLTTIAAGQVIKVTVDDDDVNERTENTGDYVGLYVLGAASTAFVDWFYMNGTKAAPSSPISDAVITFTAPSTPGTYEFRFYQNNSTLEVDRLATAAFTCVPAGIVMKFSVSSLKIGPSVTWKIGTP